MIGGQAYPLRASIDIAHLYKGFAPTADQYRYALTNSNGGNILESTQRHQPAGIRSTGNEFFNRSHTIYDVPSLPQAYNPIYPPLSSNMNQSNEIVTIILKANVTGLNEILTDPLREHEYTEVSQMTYIANKEIFTFQHAGIKNSGKSTKDFAKQSFKLKLNQFAKTKDMLYGRTTFKLRAQQTDPSIIREKLAYDCLGAAGAATLQGHFARLFINEEAFGLFLMSDDSGSTFINDVLHSGDQSYGNTGPTYKGNAMSPQLEGNLVYIDDSVASYDSDVYDIDDYGNMKTTLNKTNQLVPLIEFMKQLSSIDSTRDIDVNTRGALEKLIHSPQHLILHMAVNFLIGATDGFWRQASNYYLQLDTGSHLWTLISFDFDETFGLNIERSVATEPYTSYSRPNSQRPLIDAVLKSPYYKAEFEKTIQTLVKRFFKPSVINPRLEALEAMLREDFEWDLAIPRKSPGAVPMWSLTTFEKSLKKTDEGDEASVAEWVQLRAVSLQQQLKFSDVDDLPPLEPYVNKYVWDPNHPDKISSSNENVKTSVAVQPYSKLPVVVLGSIAMVIFIQVII
ncbi:coth protein-domain-containing protein [Mycotypha africana]|uniref:coth protein-domain-containing protein n=1 Tax=Mycotypha africana TaxID=64632 RepID=UPI0023007367|nr:coth protein-domain-containing protein [Mycotypha africana]KAI8981834.1 coth protein-domain-containing protein [Mycotypha africana]